MLDEREQIKQLKDYGFTLSEIALLFDKSVSWVNSRLNKKYEPAKLSKVESEPFKPLSKDAKKREKARMAILGIIKE